jgi:hypothetical protein
MMIVKNTQNNYAFIQSLTFNYHQRTLWCLIKNQAKTNKTFRIKNTETSIKTTGIKKASIHNEKGCYGQMNCK